MRIQLSKTEKAAAGKLRGFRKYRETNCVNFSDPHLKNSDSRIKCCINLSYINQGSEKSHEGDVKWQC